MMQLDKFLDDGKPQPGPACVESSMLCLFERFKDRLPKFRWYARAVILNADCGIVIVLSKGATYTTTGGCKFKCIGKYVKEDALEFFAVSFNNQR